MLSVFMQIEIIYTDYFKHIDNNNQDKPCQNFFKTKDQFHIIERKLCKGNELIYNILSQMFLKY